jgi:uncharacterized protein (DUF2236 family)
MTPKLERSQIVFEFLDIVKQAPIAPAPLALVQRLLVRGAVEIVPRNIREVLGLDERFALPFGGEGAIRAMGAIADRFVLNGAPPAQACRRLGLSPDYLRH